MSNELKRSATSLALDHYLTRLNTGTMMTYEASQAQKHEMQPK